MTHGRWPATGLLDTRGRTTTRWRQWPCTRTAASTTCCQRGREPVRWAIPSAASVSGSYQWAPPSCPTTTACSPSSATDCELLLRPHHTEIAAGSRARQRNTVIVAPRNVDRLTREYGPTTWDVYAMLDQRPRPARSRLAARAGGSLPAPRWHRARRRLS